jgi:hypothetical protein
MPGEREPIPYIVSVVAQSVLLARIYNSTRGSLLLVIMFHGASASDPARCAATTSLSRSDRAALGSADWHRRIPPAARSTGKRHR